MSEPMPEFALLRPSTVAEAIAMRSAQAPARIVAGGTDLLVNMRRGLVETDTLIDLAGVAELKHLELTSTELTIGAGVTLAALARETAVRRQFAALGQAAEAIAGPSHRTSATVGGNLCLDTRCIYFNQSHWWRKANGFCLKYKGDTCHVAPHGKKCRAAFSGDLAPTLMVHEAEIEVAGATGVRRMPLTQLYQDDGAAHLMLRPGEMVVAVRVPLRGWRSAYAKARVRDSIDFPLAGVAVAMKLETPQTVGLRIAVTGTDSQPVGIDGLDQSFPVAPDEATLTRIDKLVQKQVTPMRTTTAAAHYRRLAAAALAKRLTAQLAAELGG